MSERWPGGIVRSTPVTPTGPLQNGTAPGVWTVDQASYWIKQGLWPTAGNFLAVEDVFSTWLYNGVGIGSQTINNGIDLTGKGGMTWVKVRNDALSNVVFDTVRGNNQVLTTNTTDAQANLPTWSPNTAETFTFGSSGFTVSKGSNTYAGGYVTGATSNTYASWTFREAPNFFDVVTYTGDGVAGRQIAHNLGSTPGMILFKATSGTGSWLVWHRYDGTKYLELNSSNAAGSGTVSIPTSSVFTIEAAANGNWNTNGTSYVAYLFGQDTSSTGIIQCGSFTTDGSGNATVNLGWEPQWIITKNATSAGSWLITDNMRGMTADRNSQFLYANLTNAEGASSSNSGIGPTATGFSVGPNAMAASSTAIYVAIRRGPMRTPTVGTTVFSPVNIPSTVSGSSVVTNFPVDLAILTQSTNTGARYIDRLRGGGLGASPYIPSYNTSAEANSVAGQGLLLSSNTGYLDYWTNTQYGSARNATYYNFRRAPSFFDEVCYTGTGVARTINHNLGVAPELIITKCRSNGTTAWMTYCSALSSPNDKYLFLNQNSAVSTVAGTWKTPTATTFGMDISFTEINNSGFTYVSYLFASCPGVSKVGSYTGTGAAQTINCGFTTGARFVLIKRTDSTGDWYVWDSARGIVAGNDPYLLLNTLDPEYTGTDYVDTDNSGFQISSTAPAAINANGGTYIFLAIS